MALDIEGVVDCGVCRKKSLGRAGRFETLHAPFSLAYRQMRILGPIVDPTAGYVASSHSPSRPPKSTISWAAGRGSGPAM